MVIRMERRRRRKERKGKREGKKGSLIHNCLKYTNSVKDYSQIVYKL